MKINERQDGYLQHTNDRSYRQNEHVRVAEEKLGRKLGKKEQVHHLDENKKNNDPSNIEVLRTSGDHTRIHSKIPMELFRTSDGSCVVVKKQRECPQCKRLFEPDNNRDVYCGLLCFTNSRLDKIPAAEELRKMVWSQPTTEVAKKFGVSDTMVSRWCKKHSIDKPERGYWQLVNSGNFCPLPQK